MKRIFVTEGDVNRTLGIDTVYVDTTDFVLEAEDKEFLIQVNNAKGHETMGGGGVTPHSFTLSFYFGKSLVLIGT